MFYICFKVISYTIIFDLVLLVPFQSRHIPVFHPVGPGLHIETPGKVDGEQPRAASAPGEGRSLMADFNKEGVWYKSKMLVQLSFCFNLKIYKYHILDT